MAIQWLPAAQEPEQQQLVPPDNQNNLTQRQDTLGLEPKKKHARPRIPHQPLCLRNAAAALLSATTACGCATPSVPGALLLFLHFLLPLFHLVREKDRG